MIVLIQLLQDRFSQFVYFTRHLTYVRHKNSFYKYPQRGGKVCCFINFLQRRISTIININKT